MVGDSDAHIVDFGCGSGSSTCVLASTFSRVHGIDILAADVEAARIRASVLARNCTFSTSSPDKIVDETVRLNPKVIILYAVLEHLTENEKLSYLRKFWDALPAGGHLITIETPNRYAYTDNHKFVMPFFHLLPNEVALKYAFRSPRPGFPQALHSRFENGGWKEYAEARARAGLGVGYQDIEEAIEEDLSEIVVGGGWDDEIKWAFPLSIDDRLLLTYFHAKQIDVPIEFARAVLSFALRKPATQAERDRNRAMTIQRWNAVIEAHSLKDAL